MCKLSLEVQMGADLNLQACLCLCCPTCSKLAGLKGCPAKCLSTTSHVSHFYRVYYLLELGEHEDNVLQQSLTLQLSQGPTVTANGAQAYEVVRYKLCFKSAQQQPAISHSSVSTATCSLCPAALCEHYHM